MKIYTKSGDTGLTSLWGGARVKKSDPRVSAYGTLDEANSAIGAALSFFPSLPSPALSLKRAQLIRIQNELFQAGAELATQDGAKNSCPLVGDTEVAALEKEIDQMETSLEPLKNFILPSGSSSGSLLHLARTIIRRAERECVDLNDEHPLRLDLIRYLNRLSDYLFVSARYVNHELKLPETTWKSAQT
jgi:cob(I)alamin adenosyltransferase